MEKVGQSLEVGYLSFRCHALGHKIIRSKVERDPSSFSHGGKSEVLLPGRGRVESGNLS